MNINCLFADSELYSARLRVVREVDGLAPFLEKYNIIIDSKKVI